MQPNVRPEALAGRSRRKLQVRTTYRGTELVPDRPREEPWRSALLIAAVSRLTLVANGHDQIRASNQTETAPAAGVRTCRVTRKRRKATGEYRRYRRHRPPARMTPSGCAALCDRVSGNTLAERGVSDAFGLQCQTPSLSATANRASCDSVTDATSGKRTQESPYSCTTSPTDTVSRVSVSRQQRPGLGRRHPVGRPR